MNLPPLFVWPGLLAFAASPMAVGAETPAPTVVMEAAASRLRPEPSSGQVEAAAGPQGISVKIQPGKEGYPGIFLINPDGKPFDFSRHGHASARLVNTGREKLSLSLRLDNNGDWKTNPFNTESISLEPGETGNVEVLFGHSYGRKKSFPLKPEAITRLLIFTLKAEHEQSFRIESITAAGIPGELPAPDEGSLRIRPEGGVLFHPDMKVDSNKQLQAKGGAKAEIMAGKGIQITFPEGRAAGSLAWRPAAGRWDLSRSLQVTVKLRNQGKAPVSPELHLESNGGPSDTTKPGPMAPGTARSVVISYIPQESWVGASDAHQPGGKELNAKPGARLTHDSVSALVVTVPPPADSSALLIESITAGLPPATALPDWLGKRPPVPGDWTLTFEDNFNGTAPDAAKWNVQGPNHWDKASAFSKDNVIVKDGLMKLRYEKRTTHHNDDPKEKEFQYTVGFLTGYDRWAQRYGYFEARTKLPTAPGLWPAFWLMPDRGREAGESWQRSSTSNGGMEFDIVEHLTRWGPYRYNIAMHWDGYGEAHKAIGTSSIYVQPDLDGFVTTGLLWLPGQAVYYFNGQEVARWEHPAIAKVPCHMMFTLPQGGWDNNAVDDQQLPDYFTADYVRVWQRKDLATKADSPVTR